jgi:hypothetical protein
VRALAIGDSQLSHLFSLLPRGLQRNSASRPVLLVRGRLALRRAKRD